jgi:hypothetical protein
VKSNIKKPAPAGFLLTQILLLNINMIIISGCSWSIGEWDVDHNAETKVSQLQHGGLGQYIEEAGTPVLNLGIPAGSNLQAAKRVQTWLERNPKEPIDKIIMLQTEWDRDYKMIFEDDFSHITDAHSLPGRWTARYYSRLSELASLGRCPVILVGGLADTIWLDDFPKEYPGVHLACQSMTNLVITGNDRVDNPVLSWYNKYSPPLIERIRSYLSDDQLPELLNMIDLGFERENWVFRHPEWFWPDGNHPNRAAHLKLYDFLVTQGYL